MTLLNYCAEDQCLEVLFCFGISGQVSRSFFRILNRSASTSALRGVSMLRQAICSPDADHFFLSMSYRNYSKAKRSVVSITVQSRASTTPRCHAAFHSLGLNTRLSTTIFTIMMIRRIFIVSLLATATMAFVVGPQQARRIFPLSSASTKTQKIVCFPPLRMVGAGIDPTSSSPSPESTELNNPSTRFGDPLSDEMKAFNKGAVGFLKRTIFDTLFAGRDYPRFYALETIARVPYFSYTAALHWYETIGMWRKAKYLKIHFAEGKWCCGLWMRLVDLTRSMLLASDSQVLRST